MWIIHTFFLMSLTVARSERVRSVLTHANLTRFFLKLGSVRVSNILKIVNKITLIVNIKFCCHC